MNSLQNKPQFSHISQALAVLGNRSVYAAKPNQLIAKIQNYHLCIRSRGQRH